MIQIKKKLKSINFSARTKAVLSGTLALAICLGVVSVMNDGGGEIPRHDGDILVDSLNISAVAAKPDETPLNETEMVTSDSIAEPENADTDFDEARATVNMDRNQILSMLTDVIEQAETQTEKENATNQKLKMIDYMDKERMIESLIETKRLSECLVLITDNAVNVTVKKQDLSQSDVAKICDIIMRETGRSANQIVISSRL